MAELAVLSEELSSFFGSKTPTSLILTGAPGTGKTTLALQVLENFKDKYKGIYLSTRVGDKTLYQQFPWIKEMEQKTKIIDSGRLFLDSLKIAEPKLEEEPVEAARALVRDLSGEEPKKVSRILYNKYFKDLNIPEIKRVYSEVEQNLPNRSMIVIDSVEGLASKYRLNEEALVYALVKDLLEGGNTDLIFVLEKERSEKLEFIADGVIGLDQDTFDGKRIRSMNLFKLRGISFKFSKYLITLADGKVRIFSPTTELSIHSIKSEVSEKAQNKTVISTGCRGLDDIMGGGFRAGTFNLITVSKDLTRPQYVPFITQILGNILLNNVGILEVSSLGYTVEESREKYSKLINTKVVDNLIRFIDYTGSKVNKSYVIPLSGRRESTLDKLTKEISELRKYNSSILYFLSLDTIEKYRGPVAIIETAEMINTIIDSKDFGIAVAKPGVEMEKQIANLAAVHINLVSIYNKLCLYCTEPKTIIYALEPGENSIFDLVPVV
jgi:KaiC/GvpD/RAD55 family RecA-like ATPase